MYEGKTAEDLLNRANVDLKADTPSVKGARRHIKYYFAMVTGVDDQLGRILEALESEGLEKNTIVVFTADHGNCIGSHNIPTKNVHYEESMRVPFLIRWPGRIPARRDDLLLSSPDIYPTLLDLLGCKDDIPKTVEGVSRASIFLTGKGKRPASQLYIWVPYGWPAWGRRGVRTHRYTLVAAKMPGEAVEHTLHDNVADPFQLKNLAAEHPGIVDRLTREHLLPWLKALEDPWLAPGGFQQEP